MTEKLKSEVKLTLQTGDVPTETNFSDWIDSEVFVTPGKDGSVAIGKNAIVTGKESLQVGNGTNSKDNSLKVGTGLIFLGSEPLNPESEPDGSIWLDSFGIVNIKSNGKIKRI